MRDAEMVVWLGDFNYRLDTTFENAKEKARRHMLAELLELVHELRCLCAPQPLVLCKHLWLRQIICSQDQLKREKDAGRIFQNFYEAPITFPPTYKVGICEFLPASFMSVWCKTDFVLEQMLGGRQFDKGSRNPCEYDTSEKRRVPAWTDRILFRGSRAAAEVPTPRFNGAGAFLLGIWTCKLLSLLTAEQQVMHSLAPVRQCYKCWSCKNHIKVTVQV